MASTEKLTETLDDAHGELWDCMIKLCPINTKKWPQLVWYKRIVALTKVSYCSELTRPLAFKNNK